MKKISKLFFVLLLIFTQARSQTEVGILHDLDGSPIMGYYDPMVYFPTSRLREVHFWNLYELGYYYDSTGSRIEGILSFDNSKVIFKEDASQDNGITLKPTRVKCFVTGKDSFFMVKNYYISKAVSIKPVYMQYIATVKDLVFAKYYDFEEYSEEKPAAEIFFVKEKGDSVWHNLSEKKRFKELALKYFGHISYLNEKITNGHYTNDDLMGIIKMCEYEEKYKKAEPIYYNRYWEEVKESNNAMYYAKIIDHSDSTWAFHYYHDSTRIYMVNYTSFYPNVKNGNFISYYSNGRVRQIISYKNNKAGETRSYNEAGIMTAHFQYIEKKHLLTKTELSIRHLSIVDSNDPLNLKGNLLPRLDVFDETHNTTYTGLYKGETLSSFYRFDGKDTIFQLTESGYDINLKSLQSDFHYFISKQDQKLAISEGAQGMLLVKLLIDENGIVKKDSLLNSIHPQLDNVVMRFVRNEFYDKGVKKFKFTPYERNNVKKQFEIILPCEILLDRYYRPPVNFNHFNDYQWNGSNNLLMQQQIMHQQIMQQQMMQRSFMMNQPTMGGMRRY